VFLPEAAPAQNEWGENKAKKIETWLYLPLTVAYEMQHNFSTPKAWYTHAIITRKEDIGAGSREQGGSCLAPHPGRLLPPSDLYPGPF